MKITKVEPFSEFIFRLTLENGVIIDVYELEIPKIGDNFDYQLITKVTKIQHNETRMNGIVCQNDPLIVSFGGLLGSFGNEKQPAASEKISIIYTIN